MEIKKLKFFEDPYSIFKAQQDQYFDPIEQELDEKFAKYPGLKTLAYHLYNGTYLDKVRNWIPKEFNIVMTYKAFLIDKKYTPELEKYLDEYYQVLHDHFIESLAIGGIGDKAQTKCMKAFASYAAKTEVDEGTIGGISINYDRFISNYYLKLLTDALIERYNAEPFDPIDMIKNFTDEGRDICSINRDPAEVEREYPGDIAKYNFNWMLYKLTPVVKDTVCDDIWIHEHFFHAYSTNPGFINYTSYVEMGHYTHPNLLVDQL